MKYCMEYCACLDNEMGHAVRHFAIYSLAK
jgi:hypothetical protein